ncbi:conjugal transfer protein TraN [Pukyongiella litopenaei]|nr:conjugal transfer protein TraN [Pukyongiella litopenaei]
MNRLAAIQYVVLTTVLAVGVGGPARAEVVCETPDYSCTGEGASTTGGLTLLRHCRKKIGRQTCTDDAPLDQCARTRASVRCAQISQTCVDYRNGECRQTRFTYECLNEDADMAPAILTKTEFGPVQEELVNTCTAHESDPECSLARTDDIEGAETRDINRKDFARSWWRKRRTYECIMPGEGDNDCAPLASDPSCRLIGDSCMVRDASGICSNREFHYRCGTGTGDLQTSCEPINVCVGDTCIGAQQENSDGFGEAAAWLNILAQMQREFREAGAQDANDVQFFKGAVRTCSKTPGRDCCDGSGIFAQCSEDNELLWDIRKAGATHYAGSTCQEKILGVCIKRRHYYCTYNSKLARVFVEELKRLKHEDWGPDPASADCGYVTVDDLANIDTKDMDLSEVFGDMLNAADVPLQGELSDFYKQRFPGAATDAQNVYGGGNP